MGARRPGRRSRRAPVRPHESSEFGRGPQHRVVAGVPAAALVPGLPRVPAPPLLGRSRARCVCRTPRRTPFRRRTLTGPRAPVPRPGPARRRTGRSGTRAGSPRGLPHTGGRALPRGVVMFVRGAPHRWITQRNRSAFAAPAGTSAAPGGTPAAASTSARRRPSSPSVRGARVPGRRLPVVTAGVGPHLSSSPWPLAGARFAGRRCDAPAHGMAARCAENVRRSGTQAAHSGAWGSLALLSPLRSLAPAGVGTSTQEDSGWTTAPRVAGT